MERTSPALYEYLRRFGYFPNPELRDGHANFRSVIAFAPEDTAAFDDKMEDAVRKFQKQHGLKETGAVDDTRMTLHSHESGG